MCSAGTGAGDDEDVTVVVAVVDSAVTNAGDYVGEEVGDFAGAKLVTPRTIAMVNLSLPELATPQALTSATPSAQS